MAELRERIHGILASDPHVGRLPIRIKLLDRDVLLTGSVRTYFQKQMAQERLSRVSGLGRIINELEVTS